MNLEEAIAKKDKVLGLFDAKDYDSVGGLSASF